VPYSIIPGLVVENGTGLPNAQSYIAESDAIDYAESIDITTDQSGNKISDTTIVNWILNALQFIEQFTYIGQQLVQPVFGDTGMQDSNGNEIYGPMGGQALQWPRQNPYMTLVEEYCPGAVLPYAPQCLLVPTGVPDGIFNAQCQLVLDQYNGVVLFQSTQQSSGLITSERIDVLATSYDTRGRSGMPQVPQAMLFLQPLLVPGSRSMLTTVRR
jgi:hypothetical protein